MSETEVDTERVAVRTYVPRYQRDEWDDHAEELDMSRSEFVRTMVQAGRRAFGDDESVEPVRPTGPGSDPSDTESAATGPPEDGASEGTDTSDLESRVLDALGAETYLSWDDLLAAVTDDIEDRLETTLQELQTADRVVYSGRNGGYTLDE